MLNMVGLVDPAQVSANSGSLTQRSRALATRLQRTDGEQIFLMPYNPGLVPLTRFSLYDAVYIKVFNLYVFFFVCSFHWVLFIVRAKRETVYFLDPLPNRMIDDECKNMVNT